MSFSTNPTFVSTKQRTYLVFFFLLLFLCIHDQQSQTQVDKFIMICVVFLFDTNQMRGGLGLNICATGIWQNGMVNVVPLFH